MKHRHPATRLRWLPAPLPMLAIGAVAFAAGAMPACGGKAVVDPGAGEGGTNNRGGAGGTSVSGSGGAGNSSGDVGSSGSSMVPKTCEELQDELEMWLDTASRCDACDDAESCDYGSPNGDVTDACGCPVALDQSNPAVLDAHFAYREWLDRGCGPLDCEKPCGISIDPTCNSTAGCDGRCR